MGLELTMNSAAALYFTDEFGQSTASAAAIASVYGWVAPIGTFLGGHLSDVCNRMFGLQGRLLVQCCGCIVMGCLVLVFAQLHTMNSSIVFLALTSIAQKASVSFTFSIVPYVDPPRTGTIAGIVASGAGFGAICFGLVFRQLESYESAFLVIGWISLAVSVLTFGINIPGNDRLLSFRCRKKAPATGEAMSNEFVIPSDLPDVDDDSSVEDFNEDTKHSRCVSVQFDLSHREDDPASKSLPFGKDAGHDTSTTGSGSSSADAVEKDDMQKLDENNVRKLDQVGKEEAKTGFCQFYTSMLRVQVDNDDEFEVKTVASVSSVASC